MRYLRLYWGLALVSVFSLTIALAELAQAAPVRDP
jgi:hypothetical protein